MRSLRVRIRTHLALACPPKPWRRRVGRSPSVAAIAAKEGGWGSACRQVQPLACLINNQTGNQTISQWLHFFRLQTNRLQLGHSKKFSATNRAAAKLDFIQDFFIQESAETLEIFQVGNQEIKFGCRVEDPAAARASIRRLVRRSELREGGKRIGRAARLILIRKFFNQRLRGTPGFSPEKNQRNQNNQTRIPTAARLSIRVLARRASPPKLRSSEGGWGAGWCKGPLLWCAQ